MTKTTELARLERRARCAALRVAGRSYSEIAKLVGCSKHTAHDDVQAVLREAAEELFGDGGDARTMLISELQKLDALYAAAYELGVLGSPMHDAEGNVLVDEDGSVRRNLPSQMWHKRAQETLAARRKLLGLDVDRHEVTHRASTPKPTVNVAVLSPAKVALLEALLREAGASLPVAALPAPVDDVVDAEIVDTDESTKGADPTHG